LATATIYGAVKVKKGEAMPTELSVRFIAASVALSERLPVTQIKCPIQNGAWSCEVPAGVLDLRFRARRFMTEFRWKFRFLQQAEGRSRGRSFSAELVRHRKRSDAATFEHGRRGDACHSRAPFVRHTSGRSRTGIDAGLAAMANERGFFAMKVFHLASTPLSRAEESDLRPRARARSGRMRSRAATTR